ncbi:MAG TPA: MJ0042-type zinc finger domain-containing protein, partial [Nitrosospira sp.]|nr:MJ0042-type zinc finger domain-containing protein [Nitrosospira sp.]
MALITRCPHCATAFRVTPSHLRTHGGDVRCGQCTQVFDGFATLTTISDPEALDLAKAEAGGGNSNHAPEVPADATVPDQGGSPAPEARSAAGQADLPETPVLEKAEDKANPELGVQGAEPGTRETREAGGPARKNEGRKIGDKRGNRR